MNAINLITEEDINLFGHTNTMEHYQVIATKSAIYPGKGTLLGMSYCAHKLAGEAGEFNEHFGKAQRDDGLFTLGQIDGPWKNGFQYYIGICPLKPERREALIKELGDVLWYVSALCNELGISMSEVAHANLSKLKSRSERNALQGSGDDR